jgi:hypothetical protein
MQGHGALPVGRSEVVHEIPEAAKRRPLPTADTGGGWCACKRFCKRHNRSSFTQVDGSGRDFVIRAVLRTNDGHRDVVATAARSEPTNVCAVPGL